MTDKSEMSRDVAQIARGVSLRISQRLGRELQHVRTTDLPPLSQETLKSIARKMRSDGSFDEGALSWGDLYSVVESVAVLTTQQGDRIPPQFADGDAFIRMMTDGNRAVTTGSPIVERGIQNVEVNGIKIKTALGPGDDCRRIFVRSSQHQLEQTTVEAVVARLAEAGLSLEPKETSE